MNTARRSPRFWVAATREVLRRPSLWPTAVRQARRFTSRRWWSCPPYLPVPDRAYLRFRFDTQYGAAGLPAPADLVTYLEWCRGEAARRTETAHVRRCRWGGPRRLR